MEAAVSEVDWFEKFFSGCALEMWRQAIAPAVTEEEVSFLEESLELEENFSVLDLPCGNGRLALPLAKAGYKITGLDFCEEYITEAKQTAAKENCKIRYLKADLRDFSIDQKFNGAFCMGNSFGYFDRQGTASFFHNVAGSLNVGAKFAIDSSMVAECFLTNAGVREWVKVGDMYMLIENQYDAIRGLVETEYTFILKNKEEKRQAVHWIYTIKEVCFMLEQAGFSILELYGTAGFEQFELGAERMLLVAEKS